MVAQDDSERSTDTARKQTSKAGQTFKLILMGCLLYLLIGIIAYPAWWYALVFNERWKSLDYWVSGNIEGLYNAAYYFVPPLLTAWLVLWLGRTQFQSRLSARSSTLASRLRSNRTFGVLTTVLVVLVTIAVLTTVPRTRESRELQARIDKMTQDSNDFMSKLKANISAPITDPTSFTFLDTAEVESLYGQNEPELIPTIVKKKIEDSKKGDASLSVPETLKASVSIEQEKSREEELRAIEKNPQRKVKDLVDYLHSVNKLKRYGPNENRPEELKKIDDAIVLFAKYGLALDEPKLRAVRDRLYAAELNRLEIELSSIHGLVLVDGDWQVASSPAGYVFRSSVVEHTSSPLSFEVHLEAKDLQPKTKVIIESLKSRPFRLTVFGNVIAGVTASDQNVRIVPIAVY